MNKYKIIIGDLIRDKQFPEDMGIVIDINDKSYTNYYKVVSTNGMTQWLPIDYIQYECEVISGNR